MKKVSIALLASFLLLASSQFIFADQEEENNLDWHRERMSSVHPEWSNEDIDERLETCHGRERSSNINQRPSN
ncbi:hypothetical protein [Amphibacillus jilinensis]|uniref:hypothetical protein n=1 Tax=Amphibacillus jilinensis TaxID=1216008 RepID=UPI0003080996|nr:hypothetical protein [Amphibacillus jilinensis]